MDTAWFLTTISFSRGGVYGADLTLAIRCRMSSNRWLARLGNPLVQSSTDVIISRFIECPWREDMPFISITRLRVRSLRFVPGFALHTLASLRQVRRADGFQDGALLPDRGLTFWTMTAWDSEDSMGRYMTAGSHKKAMLRLMEWCDEASVVHWEQHQDVLPSWTEADRRMRADGRGSKVRKPSPQHATLSYRAPRPREGGPIRAAGK